MNKVFLLRILLLNINNITYATEEKKNNENKDEAKKEEKKNDNSKLINNYFNSDGTRKTNNIGNLKNFILIPIGIYLVVDIILYLVLLIAGKKPRFSLSVINLYFNYKVSENNKKYLY